MSDIPFREVIAKATGGCVPYAYQCRPAGGDDADPEGNFTRGTACSSRLIEIPCVFLTSRFRKKDRKDCVAALTEFEAKRKAKDAAAGAGLICVSTQVVEAGADVSAVGLWSEVASWPSLVQRLGRLNRDGRDNAEARAFFFPARLKDRKTKKGAKIGPHLAEAVAQGEPSAFSSPNSSVVSTCPASNLPQRPTRPRAILRRPRSCRPPRPARSWATGTTASPTPKRRKPDQICGSQKL